MDESERPKMNELAEELELWQTYREVHREKGIDIAQFYSVLATKLEEGLQPVVRAEFRELCDAGCLPEGLAVLVELLRYSPNLQQAWTELVGQPDNREKKKNALERAANTLENLFGDALAAGSQAEVDVFTRDRVPVSRVVSELRTHARFVGFAERLRKDTETRSPVEFSRYVLTSYVKRMTGEFHDRCLSGLVGEAVGPIDYGETAQSMWRFRNYARLDGHHSGIVKFLVAMSVVMAHTR
jgi:hypothetical protein